MTRQTYHEELELLEQHVLAMGRLCAAMLSDAVEALQQSDVALVEKVLAQDDDVDAADLEIEMKLHASSGLQQPMARDLRQIGTALKVITDLERVGDHAVDIAKIGRKLTQQLFRAAAAGRYWPTGGDGPKDASPEPGKHGPA